MTLDLNTQLLKFLFNKMEMVIVIQSHGLREKTELSIIMPQNNQSINSHVHSLM